MKLVISIIFSGIAYIIGQKFFHLNGTLLYIVSGIFFILPLFLTTDSDDSEKKSDPSSVDVNDLDFDKIVEISKEGESDYIKAKQKAITILHKFGIKKLYKKDKEGNDIVENLFPEDAERISDEDIIYEFSKLADIRTRFNYDWTYPEGNAAESRRQSKIDGIIFLLAYCPEYVKHVVSHEEFIEMWKSERLRKIALYEFIKSHDLSTIWDKLKGKFDDYLIEINDGSRSDKFVDFEEFFKVFYDVYASYLKDKFGIEVTNPFQLLQMLATHIGYFNEFQMFGESEMLQIQGKSKVLIPIRNMNKNN
ncbi:hypothetical protein DEFDS_P218 (plasmid) [Deferribacter desulfuricans SSM1]|uniref:Uncharacterized protein n=1 Tax=Deferribacter desulfuricans (strain DSM 14783 / JCM 11476 / NBRC 101012 / SSM1) TaxID=639282 RepID=D3PF46_DEFDS|nr:hypothetical protein [Deferribacter desulfuricans]BAI81838.1 hypothetical protein DEFDS_P218 [Deferribacter desulfuricans SSM1]